MARLREVACEIEARVARDGARREFFAVLIGLDAIGKPRRHAMRGGEHQLARERGAGAQIAARVHHHHDCARRPAGGRRGVAADGESGRAEREGGEGEDRRRMGAMSLGTLRLSMTRGARLPSPLVGEGTRAEAKPSEGG